MADLQKLAQRIQDVHERYQQEFANRSRITRSLDRLDGMIATIEGVLSEAGADPDAHANLLPTAQSRLELYRNERGRIAEAQQGGPAEVLAHRVSEWTWLNTQRYRRNFAGQSRVTRDLGLLLEMAEEQRRWQDSLRQAAGSQPDSWRADLMAQLGQDAELYAREAEAIRQARHDLATARQVGTHATLANGQFALWREHFAQRARSGRRLRLLERMLGQLQDILARMTATDSADPNATTNAANMRKVQDRIQTWQREKDLIARAIANAGPDSVASTLANDANEHFQSYRSNFAGKARSSADLNLLGNICERLHEIARTMDTLDRTWAIERNAKNLGVVLENLKMYEREYVAIQKSQQTTH